MVLLNGPVQNALFCFMDRYRNVFVWFMPRNCRFPKVGIHGCQRANHRLPLQGPADSQRLELLVPNLGTIHGLPLQANTRSQKLELFQPGNHRLLLHRTSGSLRLELIVWQGTAGSQRLELLVPNLETRGYHRKELPGPKDWN